jgi:hypothetical protein
MTNQRRFVVTYYVPSAPRDHRSRTADCFDTYEAALEFFLDANLACLFSDGYKIAETVRADQ